MASWKWVCGILCAYGFVKSMRPAEPYLTEYLLGPPINLTQTEIYSQVYPVATYSYLCLLLIILILTDLLRYKPFIILEAVTLIPTYGLLIWGRTRLLMQVVEFLYAMSSASEIAYFTYMYTKVPSKYYQKVTGYTRAALLSGFFLSGVIGQILTQTKALSYNQLLYITFIGGMVALILACILPAVKNSIYFHRYEFVSKDELSSNTDLINNQPSSIEKTVVTGRSTSLTDEDNILLNAQDNGSKYSSTQEESRSSPVADKQTMLNGISTIEAAGIPFSNGYHNNNTASEIPPVETSLKRKLQVGFWAMRQDLKMTYSSTDTIKWSVWWAFGTCLNLQIGNYIQLLWEEIYPSDPDASIYNGAVESVHTLLGALGALMVSFITLDWSVYGEVTLMVVSLLDAAALMWMSYTDQIWIAYVMYIFFRASYQILITIASYQVAKDLKMDSYGLIFGCNTFLALCIQTALTFILVDDVGFKARPRVQFLVYGLYSLVIGIVFLVTVIFTYSQRRKLTITNPDIPS